MILQHIAPILLTTFVLMVPSEYPTIQSAIVAATVGDTVLVAPGTYTENINFIGKEITVTSEMGYQSTTIDGSNATNPDSASVVFFTNSEGEGTVLSGFTIRGGTGTQNADNRRGGGILIEDASPLIAYNLLTNNSVESTENAYGGAILATGTSNPVILGNKIQMNSSFSSSGNGYGGGICYNYGASMTIIANEVTGNTAEVGGGVYGKHESQSILQNNVICQNQADLGGGTGFNPGVEVSLINNVICDNIALIRGGGLFAQISQVSLLNSIIWSNSAPIGSQICLGDQGSYAELSVDYNDLQFGEDSIQIEPGSSLNWGIGNLDESPVFNLDSLSEFQLSENSPCIDAGDPDPYFFDPEDPENPGNPLWPSLGTLINDMGAFGGNGSSTWMGITSEATTSPPGRISINLSPNPVYSSLQVSFSLPQKQDGEVIISIHDLLGRLVHRECLALEESEQNETSLDLNRLCNGIYLCSVRLGSLEGRASLVVLR